ncbi:MAG TPA: thioredoxin domain-containing protein, partial [Candidatus Limnocylindria bacterium]|nr:thioredoxin domain-containing protein [Candidatus Limnocylindria bacterium]
RPRSLVDSATPAANSVAADVLLRLALLSGDEDHDRRARSILRAVAPALDRQPSAFGRMLCAVDRSLAGPSDAVVAAAAPDDALAVRLRQAAARPYAPDLVIAATSPGSSTSSWPIFADKLPRDGTATAYVCRGYACEAPTSDPSVAVEQVERLATRP